MNPPKVKEKPVREGPLVLSGGAINVETFLLEVADAVNTTLDLDRLLARIAELVRQVIPYEIFAILLLNERTQEMSIRFSIGHAPEMVRLARVKVGNGVTGTSAARREPVLVNDVSKSQNYINIHPAVQAELAVPLIVKNRVIGVIDIQAAQVDYFTEEHKRLLQLLASRVAVTVENARLYTRVLRQAETLAVLNEIARELTSILDLDQLLKRIAEVFARLIDYQMFSILLVDESGQKLQHRFSLRFKESIQLKHDIPVGEGLVGAAAATGQAVLVPDVSKDQRYINLNPETRSELVVPLIYKDKVIGVLDLEHTRKGFFHDEHVRTATTLAAQIGIAIENARLYERIAREEQRLERDLAMAREVQNHLLPPCCPVLPNADVAAKFVPAQQIGGDMYDFLDYSGECLALAVGDVSGKGAPAALYAALVAGIMRSTAGSEPSPADMLMAINLSLNERRLEAQYVTLAYALWDDGRKLMTIANSGLPRPMYCKGGKVQTVEVAGLPLGLFEEAEYDEVSIQAEPGDVFVLLTDGIIDATNAEGSQFGRGRAEEVVARNWDRSAEEIAEAIYRAALEFAAGQPVFDDQTIVTLKVKEEGKRKKKIS